MADDDDPPPDDEPIVIEFERTNPDGSTTIEHYVPGVVPGLDPKDRLSPAEIRATGDHYRGLARLCDETLKGGGAAGIPTEEMARGALWAAEDGRTVEALETRLAYLTDAIRRSAELIAKRASGPKPRLAVEHIRKIEGWMAEAAMTASLIDHFDPSEGGDSDTPSDSVK